MPFPCHPSRGNRHYPPLVKRKDLPLSDEHDDHAPGTLTWLQAWYAMHCHGTRENAHGVSIGTLDNPGWSVSIDLGGTRWAKQRLDRVGTYRSEHDWVVVWKKGSCFEAATGPLNLGEALHAFRLWVEGQPSLAD